MPANAAAWYMAKRNFYLDKPYPLQLLPYLLKHYPKKFQVLTQNKVEFLEIFNKEVKILFVAFMFLAVWPLIFHILDFRYFYTNA